MNNDLDTQDLEQGVETTVDAAATEKYNAKVAEIKVGVEVLKTLTLSPELTKVVESGVIETWNVLKDDETSAEAKKTAKEVLVESFGGSDALKDYADGAMKEENAKFAGLAKAVSTLNTINSFYARRANSGSKKKVKTRVITIDNEMYNVSSDYFAEIADKDRDEKIQLLLAHADTTKEETVEL